jgi:hypothetical protein
MGVDHGGADIAVSEQLLDGADDGAPLQTVGGMTWPQASVAEPPGMAGGVAAMARSGDPAAE